MDFTGAHWRKSSFSGGNSSGDGCVEVAFLADGDIALRDSKDPTCAPHVFTPREWDCFVAAIHAGELTHP